ncbi:hypothetical protein ACOMHN_004304 [Nucella lapillus]
MLTFLPTRVHTSKAGILKIHPHDFQTTPATVYDPEHDTEKARSYTTVPCPASTNDSPDKPDPTDPNHDTTIQIFTSPLLRAASPTERVSLNDETPTMTPQYRYSPLLC